MINALPFGIMVLWLIGGQVAKGARRYGVPSLTLILVLLEQFRKGIKDNKKKAITALLFILAVPILSMGYGVNSWIMKLLKREWLVRLVYALTLSLPLIIYGIINSAGISTLILCPSLIISSFQLRAGKLFSIGDFDILVEDIARSLAFGFSVLFLIK